MAKEDKDQKDGQTKKAELSPEEAAAKSKKKKLIFLILAGTILTVGAGGGAAFFLMGGDSQDPAPSGDAPGGDHAEASSASAETHGDKGEAPKGAQTEKKAESGAGDHAETGKGASGTPPQTKGQDSDIGCVVPFKPFHLNLRNPLENRYLRLEIALLYGCGEMHKEEIEKRRLQLRDAVISVASRKSREFLLGPDGKEQLRREIHNRINHYMKHPIDDVFITDILIE